MANPIKPRRSYTANSVPLTTDLAQNELAVNWTDGKLFTKNAAGQILTLTLGGGGGGGNASLPATIQGSLSVAGDDQFDSVSLLLPFNGNLVDRSNYQHVVTAYGSAAATGTAKYGGNSLALNGSTDYLSVPSSSVFSFPGDFTIEAWVYLTSASGPWTGAYGACVAATYTGSGTNPGWQLRLNGDSSGYSTINLYTGATDLNWSASISLNAWHHVAVCRSGSSIRAFLDGTQVGSTTTNSDSLTPSNANALYIGKLVYYNYHFYLPGRIDDLRITRAARYTANFTPPAAALPTTGTYSLSPVTLAVTGGSGSGGGVVWSSAPASPTSSGTAGDIARDSNYVYVCTASSTWRRAPIKTWDANFDSVSLLLHLNAEGSATATSDSSAIRKSLTLENSAVLSSTASKFGGSSLYSGAANNAHLLTQHHADLSLGTGDFTVECWVNAASTPSDKGIFDCRSGQVSTEAQRRDGFTLTAYSSSVIRIYSDGVLISSSGTSYTGTWVHVAVVRQSGVMTLYVDGVSQGTSSATRDMTNDDFVIGGGRYGGSGTVWVDQYTPSNFPGYIDEFRVTKGVARYTANFTPTSTAFADS